MGALYCPPQALQALSLSPVHVFSLFSPFIIIFRIVFHSLQPLLTIHHNHTILPSPHTPYIIPTMAMARAVAPAPAPAQKRAAAQKRAPADKASRPAGIMKAARVTKPKAAGARASGAKKPSKTATAKTPAELADVENPCTSAQLPKPGLPSIPTQHKLPVSNARGCEETPLPAFGIDLVWLQDPVRIMPVMEAPDHLTTLPKPNHRYLSANGKRLWNKRYDMVVQMPRRTRSRKRDAQESASQHSPKSSQ